MHAARGEEVTSGRRMAARGRASASRQRRFSHLLSAPSRRRSRRRRRRAESTDRRRRRRGRSRCNVCRAVSSRQVPRSTLSRVAARARAKVAEVAGIVTEGLNTRGESIRRVVVRWWGPYTRGAATCDRRAHHSTTILR